MIRRFCYLCQTEIFECMGSVNAGDFLKFMKDRFYYVRELCPNCVTKFANSKNETYPEDNQNENFN